LKTKTGKKKGRE